MRLAVVLVVFIAVLESVFTNDLTAATSVTGVVEVVSTIVEVEWMMTIFERERSSEVGTISSAKSRRKGTECVFSDFIIIVSLQTSRGTNGIEQNIDIQISYRRSSIPPPGL